MKKIRLIDIEMPRSIQSIVNMIANIISYVISLFISFFLTPYIVRTLGAEATGFFSLAMNFVSYATLVRTALNGVGSRYIIVSFHKGKIDEANKYFSSLFFGDLFISIVFFFLGVGCVLNLEKIISISDSLLIDVKILFSLVFFNFIFTCATGIINVSCQVKNKVYLQSIRDIQGYIIRAVLLVVLFGFFTPKAFFLGLSVIAPSVVAALYNFYYWKKLTPELVISKDLASFSVIKKLVSKGIWNSFSSLGTILLTNFDLLIANLLLSEKDMGVLSVSKSMPGMISGFGATIATVFLPSITIDYAKEDKRIVAKTIVDAVRITTFVVTIPLSFLFAFGINFYSLWQPTLDPLQLQMLSCLAVFGLIFTVSGSILANVFTVTLHVKQSAVIVFVTGLISILSTYIVVKFTNFGVYAIAGVSSFVNAISYLFFIATLAAKFLGLKRTYFMKAIFSSCYSIIVLSVIGYILNKLLNPNTWLLLIITAVIFATISAIINYFIVLEKNTRKIVYGFLVKKLNLNKGVKQ